MSITTMQLSLTPETTTPTKSQVAICALQVEHLQNYLHNSDEFTFKAFLLDNLPGKLQAQLIFCEVNQKTLKSLQKLCHRFQHVPIIAILQEDIDAKLLFAQGIHDYLYQNEVTVSTLTQFSKKALARESVKKSLTDAVSPTNLATQQASKIIENSPAMISQWYMPNPTSIKFIYVSQNIKQFGYSSQELMDGTVSWLEVMHPDDYRVTLKKYIQFVKTGASSFTVSYRILTRDGQLRWIEDHSSIERDSEGGIRYFQGLILDITERKKTELLLKEREDTLLQHNNSLQLILDSIDFGVLIVDADLRLRLANQKFRRLFQFEHNFIEQCPHFTDMLEKNRYSKLYAIAPDKWPTYVQYRLDEVMQGQAQNALMQRADGTVLKYNIQILPDGGRMLTYYDITDLRKAEEKTRQEQKLLRTIIDATPDWIFVKDKNHRFILSNKSMAHDLGYQPEDLIGKTDLEVGIPKDVVLGNPEKGIRGYWNDDDEVIQTGKSKILKNETSIIGGKLFYLNTSKHVLEIDDSESRALLGFIQDITALKEAEVALQQKTDYLEVLHETALGLMNRLDLSELLDKLAVHIKELSGAEDSFIYFVNEQEQALELVNSAGRFPKNTVNSRISYGHGVVGTVWRTAHPLMISNYAEWQNRLSNSNTNNMQVVAAFPITSAGKVVGVLGIASDKKLENLHQDIMNLLPGFARLASVAIDNARLHQRTKTDLIRTRALYNVSQSIHTTQSVDDLLLQILENARSALSARWAVAYKFDSDYSHIENFVRIPETDNPLRRLSVEELDKGLLRWTIVNKKTTLSPKGLDDPRESNAIQSSRKERNIGSVIVAPLLYMDKPIGCLSFLNHLNDPDFTNDDVELLTVIAQQAALALAQHELNLQIQYQAFHDAITDLPNRRLFEDRLQHSLAHAERYKTIMAVLFIDLDGFKHVNDTLGHHVGDALLIEVANRLKVRTRESDTLARMGGDEFALILNNLRQPEDAIRVAESYLDLFQKAYVVNHQKLFVGASIGISLYPEDGNDPSSLLKHADNAMYQAKAEGKNSVRSFTEALAKQAKERLNLENALRHAIENNELELYYQPQINLQTGQCLGVEALLRWNSPKHGFISPAKFIPIAEESGLMLPIGEWVLQQACQQNAAWQKLGYQKLRMGVNISALQFERKNFMDSVVQALEASGLDAESLELEVTESVVMKNIETVIMRLKELRSFGISISIDDFGIGYSSLQYLQRLPINSLKIDRSFVNMIESDNPSLLLTILQLGRNFNLRIVAEGIETQSQLEFLFNEGCDEAQGYYFAKPLPASQFEQLWLRHQ